MLFPDILSDQVFTFMIVTDLNLDLFTISIFLALTMSFLFFALAYFFIVSLAESSVLNKIVDAAFFFIALTSSFFVETITRLPALDAASAFAEAVPISDIMNTVMSRSEMLFVRPLIFICPSLL